MKPAILYEVYPKRALLEPFQDLVLMDRCWNKKKAITSARAWGAMVIRVEAEILTKYPLTRKVISSAVVFVHNPQRPGGGQGRDKVTRKKVMGKLKTKYRTFRRK